MQADYIVRPLTEDDTDEIVNLLETCLGKTNVPRTREFWEWKHIRNPFGPSPALVAESGKKLVGLRVFMRWCWNGGGSKIAAVRAVDTVTHPDWQGQGIFSRLTTTLLEQMRPEGVSFVFNTPNRYSMPGYKKMGWRVVTKLPLWVRPLNPVRMAMGLFRKSEQDIVDHDVQPDTQDILPEESLEKLLQNMRSDKRLHTDRSGAYLRWRYVEIPGFSYHTRSRTEREAAALLIFRNRMRKNFRELSVSELLLSPNVEGIRMGTELLDEITKKSSADYAIAIAADNTPEQAALSRSGFFPLRWIGPVLTARQLEDTETSSGILNWSNWRCSIGDLEIF